MYPRVCHRQTPPPLSLSSLTPCPRVRFYWPAQPELDASIASGAAGPSERSLQLGQNTTHANSRELSPSALRSCGTYGGSRIRKKSLGVNVGRWNSSGTTLSSLFSGSGTPHKLQNSFYRGHVCASFPVFRCFFFSRTWTYYNTPPTATPMMIIKLRGTEQKKGSSVTGQRGMQ